MDKSVKAVLVNIFAGINRCDWVAQGVVKAVEMEPLERAADRPPRRHACRGGPRILAESGVDLITATSLADAAQKSVAAATHPRRLRDAPWPS